MYAGPMVELSGAVVDSAILTGGSGSFAAAFALRKLSGALAGRVERVEGRRSGLRGSGGVFEVCEFWL